MAIIKCIMVARVKYDVSRRRNVIRKRIQLLNCGVSVLKAFTHCVYRPCIRDCVNDCHAMCDDIHPRARRDGRPGNVDGI